LQLFLLAFAYVIIVGGRGFVNRFIFVILRLEVLIAFLHYTKSWVTLEILGPHCNEHQNSTSDLVMGSAIGDQSLQCLGERPRRDFAMKLLATVLRKRLREYEGIKLNIRVSVSKTLEDSCGDISCASKIFDYMQIKERRR
jgi:hypothetical protein